MARAALGISTYELAERAGVSRDTVNRIEAGDTTLKAKTVAAVRAVLEAAGMRFRDDGDEVCVRLERQEGSGPSTIPVEDLNAENDE
jgi:transcriptional regulator with XRE-family HTH domain